MMLHCFIPLSQASGFTEFGNGLGFAGCLGLVDGYLGVDLLDHTTAGEGNKAGWRCLGQCGEIFRCGLCAALVNHVVSEGLGLGRLGQCPCRAHSDYRHRQGVQGHGR